jgi:hypothetical protein
MNRSRQPLVQHSHARERWIPMGSQDMQFDMYTEMRRAAVDLIRGNQPTNLLGILMVTHEPIPVAEIAARLQKPVGQVEWIIEQLEEEDLCERMTRDGITRVFGFAAFSARNTL